MSQIVICTKISGDSLARPSLQLVQDSVQDFIMRAHVKVTTHHHLLPPPTPWYTWLEVTSWSRDTAAGHPVVSQSQSVEWLGAQSADIGDTQFSRQPVASWS